MVGWLLMGGWMGWWVDVVQVPFVAGWLEANCTEGSSMFPASPTSPRDLPPPIPPVIRIPAQARTSPHSCAVSRSDRYQRCMSGSRHPAAAKHPAAAAADAGCCLPPSTDRIGPSSAFCVFHPYTPRISSGAWMMGEVGGHGRVVVWWGSNLHLSLGRFLYRREI